MNRAVLVVALLVIAVAAGAFLWWQRQAAPPAEVTVPSVQPEAAAPTPEEPAIKYPIESVAPEQQSEAAPVPENVDNSIDAALVDLLGRDAVASFLRVTGFPGHVVATVDNLARSHASPKMWPVNPMPERFVFEGSERDRVISDENSKRYVPFVRFVE